jgi:hypothetical protein
MKRFTDAGRRALRDNNLYAALSLALTIPDICGSLETLVLVNHKNDMSNGARSDRT